MTSYLQSLTSTLHDKGLLTDELKNILIEHDRLMASKPSIKMPFGAHRGKTLREIHAFKPAYLEWLLKQSYIKDKFQDIYEEASILINQTK